MAEDDVFINASPQLKEQYQRMEYWLSAMLYSDDSEKCRFDSWELVFTLNGELRRAEVSLKIKEADNA